MAIRHSRSEESLLSLGNPNGQEIYHGEAGEKAGLNGHSVETMPIGATRRMLPAITVQGDGVHGGLSRFRRGAISDGGRKRLSSRSSHDVSQVGKDPSEEVLDKSRTLEYFDKKGQLELIANRPIYSGNFFKQFVPIVFSEVSQSCLACIKGDFTRLDLMTYFRKMACILEKHIPTKKKMEGGRLRDVALNESDAQAIIAELKSGFVNKRDQVAISLKSEASPEKIKLEIADIPPSQLGLWIDMIRKSAIKPLRELVPEQYRMGIQDLVDCAGLLADVGPIVRGKPESINQYTELCLRYLGLVNGLKALAPHGEVDLLGLALQIKRQKSTTASSLQVPEGVEASRLVKPFDEEESQQIIVNYRKCKLLKSILTILAKAPHRQNGNPCCIEILDAALTIFDKEASGRDLRKLAALIDQTINLMSNLEAVVPKQQSESKSKNPSDTSIKHEFDAGRIGLMASKLALAKDMQENIKQFTEKLISSPVVVAHALDESEL